MLVYYTTSAQYAIYTKVIQLIFFISEKIKNIIVELPNY